MPMQMSLQSCRLLSMIPHYAFIFGPPGGGVFSVYVYLVCFILVCIFGMFFCLVYYFSSAA